MNEKQISQDDLILYALHDMTPAEAAEVRIHLEHSEAARAELAQIQSDLAAYAMTSELHSPPQQARDRFLRRVNKERKAIPMERPVAAAALNRDQTRDQISDAEPVLIPRRIVSIDEAPRSSRMGFFSWAGWAVAACCAAAVGLQYQRHEALKEEFYNQNTRLAQVTADAQRAEDVLKMFTDGGAMQVALHLPASGNPEPPKPEGHAAYMPDSGKLVFIGLHLPRLETYKTYELWVIPADGHDPIPAGIFKPDQRGFASVIMPDIPKGIPAKTFGVTVEDDGGSKSPTMPIVLAGM